MVGSMWANPPSVLPLVLVMVSMGKRNWVCACGTAVLTGVMTTELTGTLTLAVATSWMASFGRLIAAS